MELLLSPIEPIQWRASRPVGLEVKLLTLNLLPNQVHTFGNPYRAQPVIAMDVEKGRQLAVPAEITFLQAINHSSQLELR